MTHSIVSQRGVVRGRAKPTKTVGAEVTTQHPAPNLPDTIGRLLGYARHIGVPCILCILHFRKRGNRTAGVSELR